MTSAGESKALCTAADIDEDARAVLRDVRPGSRPIADLHADTAMHARPLAAAEDHPGLAMRLWNAALRPFAPGISRQLTRGTLDTWGRGLQVLSTTQEGLPPFFRGSHRLYTQAVARWPKHANDTPLTAFIFQCGFIYRQVARHADRLRLARSYDEVVRAINDGRVAVRIGMEGATPLLPRPDNAGALAALRAQRACGLPEDLPLPAEEELASRAGLVAYAARVGVMYVSLSHLSSTPLAGSDTPGARARHAGVGREAPALLAELAQSGILLDLAHASVAAQAELRGQSGLPVIASHALVHDPTHRYSRANWRALADDAYAEVERTGGLVGVIFAKLYLEHGSVADVVDEIDYVVRRLGIDYVAFGSDADGFVELVIPDLGRIHDVVAALRQRGYSEQQIDKICYANALRVLRLTERLAQAKRLGCTM